MKSVSKMIKLMANFNCISCLIFFERNVKSVFIRVESCFAVDFDMEEYVYHVF